jgi:hypothetical protein
LVQSAGGDPGQQALKQLEVHDEPGRAEARPVDSRSRSEQTVTPPSVSARYNFLYSPQGRPAGGLRPPSAATPDGGSTRIGGLQMARLIGDDIYLCSFHDALKL